MMRYELKYFIEAYEFERCMRVVGQHPASFRKEYADRTVNNIYLDSPDLNAYHAAQAGVMNRIKYRIRWYGSWQNLKNPVLEQKIKQNQLGTKQHYPIQPFALERLSYVIDELKILGKIPRHLFPSCTNSYLRSYFRSLCGNYRITVDRQLSFESIMSGNLRPGNKSPYIVLEVKYDQDKDDHAEWITQYIPFKRTRFSKYTEGLLAKNVY